MKENWFVNINHISSAIDGAFFSYKYVLDIYYKLCLFFGIFCWILVFEFLLDASKEKFERKIAKRATITFWSIYIIAFILSVFLRPNLCATYMVIPVGIFYIALTLGFLHFKKFRLMFILFFAPIFIVGYSEYRLKVQDEEYKHITSYIQNNIPSNTLLLYQDTWDHLLLMYDAQKFDKYYTPVHKYMILFQDEVQKEDENIKKIDTYEHFYTVTSLYNLIEFSHCTKQFTSLYDNVSYCFKEVSKKEALTAIEKTKKTRESSFHQTKVWSK